MKIIKVVIVSLLIVLAIPSAILLRCRTYSTPLNEQKTIKFYEPSEKVYAYNNLILTPTKYTRSFLTNTIEAKAIYKGETIGIKIQSENFGSKIVFKSIGQQSDAFVKAISELYEEEYTSDAKMCEEVEGWFMNEEYINLLTSKASYKTSVTKDKKEVTIYLTIDLPNNEIEIGERWNGLNKKSFVSIFKEK